MIKVTLTNEILNYITEIEQNRYKVSSVKLWYDDLPVDSANN